MCVAFWHLPGNIFLTLQAYCMRPAHVFNQTGRFESDALPAGHFRRFPAAQLFIWIRLLISSSG